MGEVAGIVYGLSSKGWIGRELFKLWLAYASLPSLCYTCSTLSFSDGWPLIPFPPDGINRTATEGVTMFSLSPHMIHLTQPLDKDTLGHLGLTGERNAGCATVLILVYIYIYIYI